MSAAPSDSDRVMSAVDHAITDLTGQPQLGAAYAKAFVKRLAEHDVGLVIEVDSQDRSVIPGPPTDLWCGGTGPTGLRAAEDCARSHVHLDEQPVADIVGGTQTTPHDTELDDAIEIIVGDYIPDSLLRMQLAKRVLAEVMRRTGLGPYARPVQ